MKFSIKLIGAAIEIHIRIGPGLSESAYKDDLVWDLKDLGFKVRLQVPMPFIYKEVRQELGYRIDLIINAKVIVKIKVVEVLAPVHFAQPLTYLKLSGLKPGLLMNLNQKH